MTKLTFFGGVNEIGGNKILLEDSGTKIFLDFGMPFSQVGKFFSEFLQPRKCGGIGDFLEFGLLPDLKGLYRRDYLQHIGIKDGRHYFPKDDGIKTFKEVYLRLFEKSGYSKKPLKPRKSFFQEFHEIAPTSYLYWL